jgi:hypothetical protein
VYDTKMSQMMVFNMNLPSSVVVTGFIVAIVWFGVAYQPNHAWAYEQTAALKTNSEAAFNEPENTESDAPLIEFSSAPAAGPSASIGDPSRSSSEQGKKSIKSFDLEGLTANVSLAEVQQLWLDFGDRYDLHNRLTGMRVSSYALYKNFNDDYSRADVTVGYSSDSLRGKRRVETSAEVRVPTGSYNMLLEAGKHSRSEVDNAWKEVDYDRIIDAILEEHVVNTSGSVISSAIYVLYKE